MPGHIKCQRFGDFQQFADFTDKLIQFALLLAVGAVTVVPVQHGQHIQRVAIVSVDDLLQGRLDAQGEHLPGFLAFIGQHTVADIAFPQVDHVHERHSPGVKTEHEKVAGQRIFGVHGRQVGIVDSPEGLTRQGALAGGHLLDAFSVKGIAGSRGEKPAFDRPVVNGAQVSQVKYDGIGPQAPGQEPSFVTFEPFGRELLGIQFTATQIPGKHAVCHLVICSRTDPSRSLILRDVERETGHEIRACLVAGSPRE